VANNQNFIVKNGLTVGGNQYVIDSSGNWLGPQTAYANASFATANVKSHTYTQDTTPSTANIGDFWIDSSNGIEYLYTTSNSTNIWVEYGPIGSVTGNIVFSDQTIIGTVAGRDMTILQQGSGNLNLLSANVYTNGTMHIANHTFSNTDAALHIIGSDDGAFAIPVNPGYMIHVSGRANTPSRIINDSYGLGAYSIIANRTARGSASSPSALLNGDVISRYSASAHDGTSFPFLGTGRIDFVATENQTVTNKGSRIEFWTMQTGSNNLINIATFNGTSATFLGNIIANNNPQFSHFYGLNVESQLIIANSVTSYTNSAFRIVGSNNSLFQPATNPGYMMHITGQDNTPSRIVNDAFGTSAYSVYVGRSARGNTAYPQALQTGDILTRFSGSGYGTTFFPQFGSGRMDIVASENHTDTTKGTVIQFWTTPIGTTTLTNIASFNGLTVTFTGNVVSNTVNHISYFRDVKVEGSLLVNTSIFIANTTQYIDYSLVSLILMNVSGTTTLSHLNYRTGATIEVIAHNNTGADQTVNLSIPAVNCTAIRDKNGKYNAPANTVTLFAGTTGNYRFTSFDGDNANVYCVITPT